MKAYLVAPLMVVLLVACSWNSSFAQEEKISEQHLFASAMTLSQKRDYNNALKALDALVEEGKAMRPSALLLRARVFYEQSQFEKAVNDYQLYFEDYGKTKRSEIYINYAAALSKNGDFDKALAQFETALALEPEKTEIFIQKGLFYKEYEMFDEALEAFETAGKKGHPKLVVHKEKANIYLEMGEKRKAIAEHNKALEIDPTFETSLMMLGRLNFEIEDYQRSIEYYTRAIQQDKSSVFAYYNRAISHFFFKNYDECIEDMHQVLKEKEDVLGAHFYLGAAYERKQVLNAAYEHMEEFVKFKPDDAEGLFRAGRIAHNLGKAKEACEYWERASSFGAEDKAKPLMNEHCQF